LLGVCAEGAGVLACFPRVLGEWNEFAHWLFSWFDSDGDSACVVFDGDAGVLYVYFLHVSSILSYRATRAVRVIDAVAAMIMAVIMLWLLRLARSRC